MPLSLPAGIAIIVIAVFIAYFPSLRGDFVLDDDLLLTENKLIKASDGVYRLWCTTEAPEYLAGGQYHYLDRVATVGNESGRVSRHQSDLACRRGIADLDHLAEVIHSRGIFGGIDLRRASGKRRVGGLDRAAKKHRWPCCSFYCRFCGI